MHDYTVFDCMYRNECADSWDHSKLCKRKYFHNQPKSPEGHGPESYNSKMTSQNP